MKKPTLLTSSSLNTFAAVLLSALVCAPAYPLDFDPYGDGAKQADQEKKAKEIERQLKAAKQEAAEARKRLADLERQMKEKEAEKKSAPVVPPAQAPAQVASSAAFSAIPAPLSVFRDKLKTGGEGPVMVVIPAGKFAMGSNDSDAYPNEKPVHRVTIKQAFAIGKTEVTQREWRQMMGSDPPELQFKGCDDCPVEHVSWNDAQSYINKLNEQAGKTTYRLPSEAEWEYACRGGKANAKYCGGNDGDAVAWYFKNSGAQTRPVAQKQANAYGLYDMSGNVYEWVEDWHHGNYNGAPQDGSVWVTGSAQKYDREMRGGAWSNDLRETRSASRFSSAPVDRYGTTGFRVARTLP